MPHFRGLEPFTGSRASPEMRHVPNHAHRLLVTLGVAALTLAPPLHAQESRMDPMSREALDQGERAYTEAYKKLTPEQQAILRTHEKPFVMLVYEDFGIMNLAKDAERCVGLPGCAIAKDPAKYGQAYSAYVHKVGGELSARKAQMLEARRAATPFIDQSLVDQHYRFVMKLKLDIATSASEASAAEQGATAEGCKAIAGVLEPYLAR
jgi:hypothetical protein